MVTYCERCGSTLAHDPKRGIWFAIAWAPVTLSDPCATRSHVPAHDGQSDEWGHAGTRDVLGDILDRARGPVTR